MSHRPSATGLVRSSAPGWIGLVVMGLLGTFLWGAKLPVHQKAVYMLFGVFAAAAGAEAFICMRTKTGLLSQPRIRSFSAPRLLTKLTGWAASVGCLAFVYWLVPEYHGAFYDPFYAAMKFAWPALAVLVLAVVWFEDQRDTDSEDSYFALGKFILSLGSTKPGPRVMKQHALQWAVKGFFLPLMFVYFAQGFELRPNFTTYVAAFDTVFSLLYFIDVVFGCVGYLFALKTLGTHVRSADPTTSGWVVAIFCYQPFWSVMGASYFPGSRTTNWSTWLTGSPLFAAWGCAILLCVGVYVWATISFGTRFSNLTHRGIVTCGPYAFCRHPAYISKCLSYLLITVPFAATPMEAVKNILLWAAIAMIYYVRAKTEESHLRSVNGDYAAYEAELAAKYRPGAAEAAPIPALAGIKALSNARALNN